MQIYEIENKLMEIIESITNEKIENIHENLFDILPAYELLYIVDPIENNFGVLIKEIIEGSDHNIMTINNLAKKIMKVKKENESCNNR